MEVFPVKNVKCFTKVFFLEKRKKKNIINKFVIELNKW